MIEFLNEHDAIFEILAGILSVLCANRIITALNKNQKTDLLPRMFLCVSLSGIIGVLKEIAEFLTDYYSKTTQWQNYSYVPARDIFLFRLLGTGTDNPEQYPVMDTDFDFMCFLLGSAAGCLLLLIIYKVKEKKSKVRNENVEKNKLLSVR